MFGGFCFSFCFNCSACTVSFLCCYFLVERNEAKCLSNSVMFFLRSFVSTWHSAFGTRHSVLLCARAQVFLLLQQCILLFYNNFIWFIGLLLFWRWMMLLFWPLALFSHSFQHSDARRAYTPCTALEPGTQWWLHFHYIRCTVYCVQSILVQRWNVNGKCSLLLLC